MPRSYHGDADEVDGLNEISEPSTLSLPRNNDASPNVEDGTSLNGSVGDGDNSGTSAPPKLLSQEDVVELARRSVENGIQETKRSLAGNEAVSYVVKPKLTIDLGHSNINRIPEAVVDIVKDEVERCVTYKGGFLLDMVALTNAKDMH